MLQKLVFMWVYLGVNPKIGGKPPKWMVKIMENPMNKWMLWGVLPPLFLGLTPTWQDDTFFITCKFSHQLDFLQGFLPNTHGKSRLSRRVESRTFFGRIFNMIFPDYLIYLDLPSAVKFVPFHPKNLPKGRNFTYLEDPGIWYISEYFDMILICYLIW